MQVNWCTLPQIVFLLVNLDLWLPKSKEPFPSGVREI